MTLSRSPVARPGRRARWLLAALLSSASAVAQPVAPPREVVDDYHGTKIADPYRWLEDLSDPAVVEWMKASSDHAAATLARIPGRASLLRRMAELDTSSSTELSALQWLPNGRLFYLKRTGAEDAQRLYVRDGFRGRERLLVDPEVLHRSTGQPHAIDHVSPSPDGRYVAYGISSGGSERNVLVILEVATGKTVDAPIDRAQFSSPSWSEDGRTVYYNRLRLLPPGTDESETLKGSSVLAHVLGTDPASDEVVFDGTFPGVSVDAADIPYLIVVPGSGHAFAIAAPGGVSPVFAAFVTPLEALKGRSTPWRRLFGPEERVHRFDVRGDDLYLVTDKAGPKQEVKRTSVRRTDLARAETIVPPGKWTIGEIVAARDAIYLETSDGVDGGLLRVPYARGRRPEPVALPGGGTVAIVGPNPSADGVLVGIAGWTRAPAIYRVGKSGRVTDTGLRPVGRFGSPPGLVASEVKVRSHDGTLVPLSIVHRRGLRRDGRNPTLLQGYGAYGFPTYPGFAPRDLAFYERGGILAFAHVRGGGEYGEAWHAGGFQKTKPNTWKDFIACAEYLVAEGYTSRGRLAAVGTSAGGILAGRALTERPDLFAAMVLRVGVLDVLRFIGTATGAPNVAEFGSPATEEGFRTLLEMSAYQHVRDGVPYPAVLLCHGVNDTRVPVWVSTKMAARLAAATSSGNPVLLRLDYESGHGQGATASDRRLERADVFAFVLWRCGAAKPGAVPGI